MSDRHVITVTISDRWAQRLGRNILRRDREVIDLLSELNDNMRDQPRAGIIAGTLDLGTPEDGGRIDVGAVDFGPVHWVALAECALEHARDRMAAMPDPPRDLIAQIERARAALDFADTASND